uniref:Uncharacterized protein n=1 Tax=Petalonia binghamiae TaxID=698476 RepID=A0A2H4ZR42_9PHAE|nr:hypothetical protein PebiMp40 [Endarachne binghamiae]AUG32991.1 hypothetical protein PebiMp40 [Endarachne binghamiae]
MLNINQDVTFFCLNKTRNNYNIVKQKTMLPRMSLILAQSEGYKSA